MEPVAVFERSAGFDDLAQIRAFVTDTVNTRIPSEDLAFRAALVVDEICSNIIEHGGDGAPVNLRISVSFPAGDVAIAVVDPTEAFDPTAVTRADIDAPADARKPGGLGLHLIHELTREVRYERTEAGNQLTVVIASDGGA